MKRDATIAIIGIIIVIAICFGLAAMRPALQPAKSTPFETASVGPAVAGHIVMRINGDPVTEKEFEAAFAQLPDDMKRQFASGPGKQAFAEQYIRMKLLEQEGHRLGIDRDPDVEAQVAADRTNILGRAAADKLVGNPTAQAVEAFYNQNVAKFATIDVSHIVIAFQGGTVKPRSGGTPLSEVEATNRALQVYQQLKAGANFGTVARKYSDDTASLVQDGHLGTFARGMLPQELEARIWQVPPGQFTGPLPSRFGIHIFKVNSRSTAALPEVSKSIAQHVKQQNTLDRVEILRKNANVDFDPKFFPEAKSWPSNNPGKRPS